jgi:hypothetical protein
MLVSRRPRASISFLLKFDKMTSTRSISHFLIAVTFHHMNGKLQCLSRQSAVTAFKSSSYARTRVCPSITLKLGNANVFDYLDKQELAGH